MEIRRIFLDVDGVLGDFVSRWLYNFNQQNGTQWTPDDVTEYDFVQQFGHKPSFAEIKRYIDHDLWTQLKLYSWAEELVKTTDNTGLPWAFLSSVWSGAAYDGRGIWLDRYFAPLLKVQPKRKLIIAVDKGLVGGPGDLLIDDAPFHAEAFKRAGGDTIILAQPWNKGHADRMTPSAIIDWIGSHCYGGY